MTQIIYILTNEAMPGYIKIGFTTTSVEQRLKELDRTGIPLPFEAYYSAEVVDARKDEEWLHSIFSDRRVRDNREFFKMNPELATLALKRIEIKEIKINADLTDDQEKEIGDIKERRSRFHFKDYGITPGEKVVFTRNPEIIAEVLENDKIRIGEKIGSLSSFAKELLGGTGRVNGTLYFIYKDEILNDMRNRIDGDN